MVAVAAAMASAFPLSGQVDLSGQVQRVSVPLSDAEVLLHRVAADSAGEVDRTRSGSDGTFRLTVPPIGEDEVFFASVRHDGILYFGHTIASPADLDSLYVIEVYDTVVAPEGRAQVSVKVRNLILEPTEGGWQVTDLIEVNNDGDRTWTAREPGSPVWQYPLPPSATDPQVGQSDLPVGAGLFENGGVTTTAAIPPGPRVYMFRYALPDLAFRLPLAGATERLEVLVEEPAPVLNVVGLSEAPPAELEPGSTFRRYVGSDLAPVDVVVLPGSETPQIPFGWLIVGMAFALATVGLWAVQQRGQAGTQPLVSTPDRASLIRAIAQLDQRYAEGPPSAQSEREYRKDRTALLNALRALDG